MEIGVDLGGTNVRVGVVDNGRIVTILSEECRAQESKERVIDQITSMIRRLISPQVDYIGVGVPSVVDARQGIVYNVISIPSWDEVPLKSILEKEFGVTVDVDNDCNCFARGIYTFGEGKGLGDVVCVALGTGVGAGVVIDGSLYRGYNTGAGEIGSLPYLDRDYEYYCSSRFFVGHGTTGKDAYHRADAGDSAMLALWQEFGHHLGDLVSAILYTYDPQAIVFGGSISQAHRFFEQAMLESLAGFPYPRTTESLKIRFSNIDNISLLGSTVKR